MSDDIEAKNVFSMRMRLPGGDVVSLDAPEGAKVIGLAISDREGRYVGVALTMDMVENLQSGLALAKGIAQAKTPGE